MIAEERLKEATDILYTALNQAGHLNKHDSVIYLSKPELWLIAMLIESINKLNATTEETLEERLRNIF